MTTKINNNYNLFGIQMSRGTHYMTCIQYIPILTFITFMFDFVTPVEPTEALYDLGVPCGP